LPSGSETALTQAIATIGPVSVIFRFCEKLQNYKGGVFVNNLCSARTKSHAVTLVGYGHDNSSRLNYYIIRNSWGK